MKHFISTTLLLLTVLSSTIFAQQISSTAYNKEIIHEDFNQQGEHFVTITTNDNYFILDKGDYLLSRNNNESEYAIIANNSTVADFVLKTELRIGPSDNKKASIGIILKAQQDGKGAIIFEINKQAEYRIKKLIGSSYQTLSGNAKQEGWVKSKNINSVDEQNFIEIRTENNIYDVYVNNIYLTTFVVPDFASGSCGLIISHETKARISYYYINTKGESNVATNYNTENTESVNTTIEELNKKIKLLEENNAKLIELNSDTKGLQTKEIGKLNSDNTNLAAITISQEKEIKSLTSTLENLQLTSSDAAANNNQLNEKVSELQQKISLEKSVSSQLLNDISNINKSSNNTISQLNIKVKELEAKISTLTKSKNTLEIDLSSAKSAHQETKNSLSKSITTKTTEINTLTKELNSAKEQLINEQNSLKNTQEKHKDLTANLKAQITNLDNSIKQLTNSLNNANDNQTNLKNKLNNLTNELNALKNTQAKHDAITNDLNNQITTLSNQVLELNSQLNTANTQNANLKTTNTELKELFVQKDFQAVGIDPSKYTKQTSTTPPAPKVLVGNKTIYSVQLGVFMQKQSDNFIKNIDNVWCKYSEQGTYIYYSGEFTSPVEAASHMNNLISKGYKNAFVVTLTR